MITEDYVSFDTAKLLKEKGFDEPTLYYYTKDGIEEYDVRKAMRTNSEIPNDLVSCPSQSLVMCWLREVHNLCIEPYRTACGYLCTISKIPTGSEIYGQKYEGDDEDSGQFTTYEKACEAAIKYCLNNINSAH